MTAKTLTAGSRQRPPRPNTAVLSGMTLEEIPSPAQAKPTVPDDSIEVLVHQHHQLHDLFEWGSRAEEAGRKVLKELTQTGRHLWQQSSRRLCRH